MSFKALAWAIDQDVGNPARKLILILLADHANHEHQCFPSQKRLSKVVGISTRQVRTHLKHLEENGFICRVPRFFKGRYTSDLYILPIPVEEMEVLALKKDHRIKSKARKSHIRRLLGFKGPVCWYCGGEGDEENGPNGRIWHLDRIHPGKKGGRYRKGNLALACSDCNLDKRGKDPLEWKGVEDLQEAFSVEIPEEVDFQRKVVSDGNEVPLTSGSQLPVDHRKSASAQEPSVDEPPTEPSKGKFLYSELMHEALCLVFDRYEGKKKWRLTPTRKARYRKVVSEFGLVDEYEFLKRWRVLCRAIWSDPWRRAEQNRHDPVNVLRSPEQREMWWNVALAEIEMGGDGSGYHGRKGEDGKAEHVENETIRARVKRSQVKKEKIREKEDQELRKEEDEALVWFRRLDPGEKVVVKQAVQKKVEKVWPEAGGECPEGVKQGCFMGVYRERRRSA